MLNMERIIFHISPELLQYLRQEFSCVYGPVITDEVTPKIVSVTDTAEVLIQDQASRVKIKSFASGQAGIRRLAVWNGPKPQIITASSDSTIKIFDFNGKQLRKIEPAHGGKFVTCVIVSQGVAYEDTILISGGGDFSVKQWNLKTAKLKFEMKGHSTSVIALCFCDGRDGVRVLASVDKAGEIRFWSLEEGTCLRVLHPTPTL